MTEINKKKRASRNIGISSQVSQERRQSSPIHQGANRRGENAMIFPDICFRRKWQKTMPDIAERPQIYSGGSTRITAKYPSRALRCECLGLHDEADRRGELGANKLDSAEYCQTQYREYFSTEMKKEGIERTNTSSGLTRTFFLWFRQPSEGYLH